MISRRRFLVGSGTAGALGMGLHRLGSARAGGPDSGARAAGRDPERVLGIVQGAPGTPPAGPGGDPLVWRLGGHEWLDPRRLDERLAGCPAARIEASVDDGNHLLLVDAVRARGGVLLRAERVPDTQRWSVVARVGALVPSAGNRFRGTEVRDDGIS